LVEVRPDVYLCFLPGALHRFASVHRIRSARPFAPLTDRYHPIRRFSDSSIPESVAAALLDRAST
jgi:hypothetical protein